MATETDKYVCPNCGGEVLPSLDVLGPDGKVSEELRIEPKGNVGVCQDCNMAVSMTKENTGENVDVAEQDKYGVDENDPEWNPRVHSEDTARPEDATFWDPRFGGSTSPEVALEDSIPQEGDPTLTPADTTQLSTDPVPESDEAALKKLEKDK